MAKAKTTPNTSRAAGSGSFRDFERGNKLKREDNLKIPLDMIGKRPGFNPRDLTKPETVEKINAIKEAYKAGEYVPAIEVMLAPNNRVTIVNGECRYTAATLAHAELVADGKDGIPHLVCVPFKGSDEDQLMLTVTSNAGEKLTVLELSEVVRRALDDLKMKKPAIAKRLQWSPSYIDKLEIICRFPQEIKDMIYHDTVSVDVAMDTIKRRGDDAVAILQRMVTLAEGVKITTAKAKALETRAMKEMAAPADTGTDGDGEGDGDGDGDATPAPAPAKKLNTKKVVSAAQAVVYALPELDQDMENIKDTKTYTLKVSGAAMKAIIELQSQFADAPEPEADADADADPEPAADGKWPFQPAGQAAA